MLSAERRAQLDGLLEAKASNSWSTLKWLGQLLGSDGRVNRRSFELCVLYQLRDGLRSGAIWLQGSRRFADPATYLIPSSQWTSRRSEVLRILGLEQEPREHFSTLSRRANGLSIAQVMRQAGSVPVHLVVDSTGLKIFGEGEWLAQKHQIKGVRLRWSKLHLGLNLHSGAIVCANLTHDDVGDSTALPGLLDQLDAPLTGFLADGAYDGSSTRDLLRERYGETLDVVIPPPKNAVIRPQSARDPTVRDRHIAQIRNNGRMAWQVATGYNQRSRIETQIVPKLKTSQLLQANHGDSE